MLFNSLLLVFGFFLITKAADLLVDSSAYIAKKYHVSPLLIGLTIIAFGTSAPEMVVSLMASIDNKPQIALGNAIGSNIANIGLVLGITCLIRPITPHSSIIKREYPILLGVMMLVLFLIFDGVFNQQEGILLLLCLAIFLAILIYDGLSKSKDSFHEDITKEIPKVIKAPWLILLLSLLLLPISAEIIIYSASFFAKYFGLSDATIGLTIVALGTSLPEVATSISGILKNEDDLALGNIIGSNIFNLLAVLPIAALKNPIFIGKSFIFRDYLAMSILSVLLIVASMVKDKLPRALGGVLLSLYIAYITWLVIG